LQTRTEKLIWPFLSEEGLIWATKEKEIRVKEKIKKRPSLHLGKNGKGKRKKANRYAMKHNNSPDCAISQSNP